jgi:alpha-galactosidase
MTQRKIVCLGAGSRYFEDVIAEIAVTPELAGSAIVLFDIDAKRMGTIMKVGQRILGKTSADLTLDSTRDLARALDGADFAISSIGVHGPGLQYHKTDCDVAGRFGVIQTTGDTVGPAGLSQGLRIIPIFVHIAKTMERYCPKAILLQHSNPMNPICRAITKYTKINVIGYCHNVIGDVHYFAKVLEVPAAELEVNIAGPNHMNWMLGIRHNGRDVYPELARRLRARKSPDKHLFAMEVYDLMGIYPIGGDRHMIEFFPHSRRATKPRNLEYGLTWRSDYIVSAQATDRLTKKLRDLALRAAGKLDVRIPTRETMSPEAMGSQLRAMTSGPEIIHFVNTPNRGAVPNLPEWAVIELKAAIGSTGARPIYAGELPPQAARWSLAQIYAHELTVDAAVEGSRRKAIQALAADPMIRDFHEAEEVFDALVKGQGDRLKRFRRKAGEGLYRAKATGKVPID